MKLFIVLLVCSFLIHCRDVSPNITLDLPSNVTSEAPSNVQEAPSNVPEDSNSNTLLSTPSNNVLTPFKWNYNVRAKDGIISFKGTGHIKLEESESTGYWIVESEIKGRALGLKKYHGVTITLLQEDPVQYFKPLKSIEEDNFNTKKEITYNAASQNYPYYDFLSAVVFFTKDLQLNPYNRQWNLWMADENQFKTFVYESDETLQTKLGPKDCYVIRKVNASERESQLQAWISKDDFKVVKMIWTKKKKIIEINIK